MLFSLFFPPAVLLGLFTISTTTEAAPSSCKCFPGDKCWPSTSTWNAFNQSIDGRLIATKPLAIPCHGPDYDAESCSALKDRWTLPEEHYETSSSIMAPFFTNGSCDPFHPVSKPCTLGNFVRYALNVSEPHHISAALKFAHKHNVRFVIRNTGHDFTGKSTGAGALSVWLHNLKNIEFKDYHDAHYTGKAVKVGAGVQGIEVYQAAHAEGLRVVSGECRSVGIAGGYTQGGGHSALNSRYGLGADQVLEWEVIDGTGQLLVANREENRDLYWALSGGGGGTYGVVLSMTSKAHPDGPVSGLTATILAEENSPEVFYQAVGLYHSFLPALVDAGAMSLGFVTNTSFKISPITAPDIPVKKLEALVQPFRNGLDKLGVKYQLHSQQFDSFLDQFLEMEISIDISNAQYGSWLIPRSVVQQNNSALTDVARSVLSNGGTFTTVGINVSKKVAGDVYNAVLPAWRDAIAHTILTTHWEFAMPQKMLENQKKMTDDFMPRLVRLAPESGAYLNEMDFRQPNFKTAFYGKNYQALRQVKAKYDPLNTFYAWTAVGSDEWTVSSTGRMCAV